MIRRERLPLTLGAIVSGFAPFLGGMARKTIGVSRLMGFTALLYTAAGLVIVYAAVRLFARDHAKARAVDEQVAADAISVQPA